MKKAEEQRKEKHKWMYDKESGPLLLKDGVVESQKLIEGSSESRPAPIETWKYKVKNELMFYPEGHTSQPEENPRIAPKEIAPANTRFETPDETNINNHAAAIAAIASGFESYASSESTSEAGTPRVAGYEFVSPTPSLNPSQVDSSELMTWGMIEGTPLQISGDQTPGPAFSLPPTHRREMLGMSLSSTASRNIRKRVSAMNTPRTPSSRSALGARMASTNARTLLLSPAARKLLRKSHKTHTSPSADLDLQLRSSYGTFRSTSLKNVPFSPARFNSPSSAYIRRSSGASSQSSSITTGSETSVSRDVVANQ
ncbi:5663_t:CDS:2 [Ambispora gerdemannii]|uniref:5663_t:CDS:1 n=1 Tax=Ambispora gerdemannii TaxID=144530 RepID=A0A9N8VCK4_9GLOM|nr:5663_t:CDS:2 [Ambispora gerdemannii]